MLQNISFLRSLDALYLIFLAMYILAGVPEVPFHGDEATVMYTARDFYYIFVRGEMRHVLYSDKPSEISPDAATEQHLRLLNGPLSRYLYGLVAYTAGYSIEQINGQWDWCCDWQYNQQTGRIPAADLLLRTRFVSALMLAGGAAVMFIIGQQTGGRPVAYLASLYFALNPALLINGRRAMMDSGLMLFSLLVVLAGLWVIRELEDNIPGRGTLRPYRHVALGVVSGLALAAKHTAIFTVGAVFAAGITYEILLVIRQVRAGLRPAPAARWVLSLIGAGLLAFLVFYILNPAWWSDPVGRAGLVLALRTDLLNGQAAAFGGYPDFGAQAMGFLRQVFVVPPQYYEVSNWQAFIGEQIAVYEASPWRGLSMGGSVPGALLFVLFIVIGVITVIRSQKISGGERWLPGIYGLTMLLTTLLLTPLEWQRYYLPAYPAAGLFAAAGLTSLMARMIRRAHIPPFLKRPTG